MRYGIDKLIHQSLLSIARNETEKQSQKSFQSKRPRKREDKTLDRTGGLLSALHLCCSKIMSSSEPLQLKLVTIGDSGVGKSWLLLRWATESDKFIKTHSMFTVGIDFKMKNVEIDDQKVKIQVWDTAGQERFRTITTSYYRSSQGILLVYDITDVKSFQSIRSWISQILLHADINVNKILIGNKCDLQQKRAVTFEEGETLAREFKMTFFETSAMTDVNVDQAFMSIARQVKERLENFDPTAPRPGNGPKINSQNLKPSKKKGGCC